MVEIVDEELSENKIKSRHCVKIQSNDWLLVGEERVLNGFCQEQCCQFMAAPIPFKLGAGLMLVPYWAIEVSNVAIKGFAQERTS